MRGVMPPKTIIVADDDAHIRSSMREILEAEGFVVHEAEDGLQTLALYEKVHPDLIILDMMMPEMDGAAFFYEVHNKKDAKKVPIIVISGLVAPQGESVDETVLYLAKPVPPAELLRNVRAILNIA